LIYNIKVRKRSKSMNKPYKQKVSVSLDEDIIAEIKGEEK